MRILVVEDDRLLNNTLCYNLNTAGYTVDSALTKSVASSFLTKQDYSHFCKSMIYIADAYSLQS